MGLEPGDGGGGGRKQHHGAEYKTPEVPLTATKMGRASPGGVQRGDTERWWSYWGYILKAE